MSKRLPVLVVGGFLGAGKTSVLHHFISEHQGGYLATLADNPDPLNLDAKALGGLCGAMRRLHDIVVAVPNGSEEEQITFIGARLRELYLTARFERVLIEVSGATNAARMARAIGEVADEWVETPRVVCVVDALDLFRGTKVRHPMAGFRDAQIREASLLILNKCDLVSDEERQACTKRLRSLNPSAKIIETDYGEVPLEVLTALGSALPEPGGMGESDDEIALGSVLYRMHRPFHPERFLEWFDGEHPGLLRVKGIIWLATRNLLVGGVSRTRWQNGCGPAGIWWAALPREEWPEEPAALARMQAVWQEPYGDRRQELVLIGDSLQLSAAAKALDRCLLTEEEYKRPVAEWKNLPDPFPEWDLGNE